MKHAATYCFILGLSACSPVIIENEAPAVNTVKKGEKFRIILPDDHTKGYTWQLNDDFDRRKISRHSEVWHGNEKGIYFTLNAKDTGKTTLSFICRKYTDTASYKRFFSSNY